MTGPPASVLAAYGVTGEPIPLPGGQGTAWRVADTMLKPADIGDAMLAWLERVLTGLDGRDDFRVAPPRRSSGNQLSVEGWTAWPYLPGEHVEARWTDIIDVGRRFHAALRDEPRPEFLDDRTDGWAIADRVAWGEVPVEDVPPTPNLDRLVDALRPLEARSQVVHGDLSGNVLFADGQPPAIIDVSPYWRPPTYADAIVVADALNFHQADIDRFERLLAEPDFDQYLLRAFIFRAVAGQLALNQP